jgi:hypothetical protein
LVITTYEYARIMLVDADAQIYLGSTTRDRCWCQAWVVVVVDEVHMIMGGRGPVVRDPRGIVVGIASPARVRVGVRTLPQRVLELADEEGIGTRLLFHELLIAMGYSLRQETSYVFEGVVVTFPNIPVPCPRPGRSRDGHLHRTR